MTAAALLPAIAPTLFLLGLTLLAGSLTRNYWATIGIASGYWLLEEITRGSITKTLFLFQATWPLPHVPYATNRWTLGILGAVFFIAGAAIAGRWRRIAG